MTRTLRCPPTTTFTVRCACAGHNRCEYAVFDELRAKPALRKRIKRMAGELHMCHPKHAMRKSCMDAEAFVMKHWPAPPTDASIGKPHGFAVV